VESGSAGRIARPTTLERQLGAELQRAPERAGPLTPEPLPTVPVMTPKLALLLVQHVPFGLLNAGVLSGRSSRRGSRA